MGFVEIFLIGVGLSMDAFAVSICKGLGMKKINFKYAVVLALFFGGFQALMPLIGWALGWQFKELITPIDHWIAFGLLAIIGGKMLWDAFHEDDDEEVEEVGERYNIPEIFMLAIATSIDALAVGVTFAFLQVNIIFAITVIGVTTFLLSLCGVMVGNRFGSKYEKASTIVGGVVLILIGLKILFEHLGFLVF